MADYMDSAVAMKCEGDIGPLQKEAMELRKRIEHLFIQVDGLGQKIRPVLRHVPEPGPEDDHPSPRLLQAELTETIGECNRLLGRLDLQIADMITRCEL